MPSDAAALRPTQRRRTQCSGGASNEAGARPMQQLRVQRSGGAFNVVAEAVAGAVALVAAVVTGGYGGGGRLWMRRNEQQQQQYRKPGDCVFVRITPPFAVASMVRPQWRTDFCARGRTRPCIMDCEKVLCCAACKTTLLFQPEAGCSRAGWGGLKFSLHKSVLIPGKIKQTV